jgi:tRNA A37 N6-isopentenylltransferase MiaA
MSDNKTTSSDLDLLIASINDLARKIGEMEPDDPVRAVRLKELYTLTELSKSLNTQPNEVKLSMGASQMNWDSKLPKRSTSSTRQEDK